MRLLLLSLGVGAVPDFLSAHGPFRAGNPRIGYVRDAARPYEGEPFVEQERERLAGLGYDLDDLTVGGLSLDRLEDALGGVDAVYVAGGSTFALLDALRTSCADRLLVEHVRAGLPYIGSSAGSIVTGPSIEPASLMDDPADAPGLTDYRGLGLLDTVVIPHADGLLPPYPPELIARTTERYGDAYPLTLVHDDQALLVDFSGARLIASP